MLSEFPVRAQQWRVFATAHSRGLRPAVVVNIHACDDLCHSAFARVATAACKQEEQDNPLCHSAFARVATAQCTAPCRFPSSLPQRIRAGCDLQVPPPLLPAWSLPQRIRAGCDLMLMPLAFADSLCHSAFVRVATPFGVSFQRAQTFATAHSRGLRRNKLINACNFVTLCHSAFVRVATYSNDCTVYMGVLCHSAFVRVATSTASHSTIPLPLCHSAFVRVATIHCVYVGVTAGFATAHSCGLRRGERQKL